MSPIRKHHTVGYPKYHDTIYMIQNTPHYRIQQYNIKRHVVQYKLHYNTCNKRKHTTYKTLQCHVPLRTTNTTQHIQYQTNKNTYRQNHPAQ